AAGLESDLAKLAFSPDGEILAALRASGVLHVWDTARNLLIDTVAFDGEIPREIEWRGDASNAILIARSDAGSVRAFRLHRDWSLERTIGDANGESPFVDRVLALDASPDGELLA